MAFEQPVMFELKLHSRSSECGRLYRFIEGSLQHSAFRDRLSLETVDDLKTAAEELFSNAVQYGHRNDPSGVVEFTLQDEGDGIRMTMRDSSPAFNPLEGEGLLPGQDLSEGGMGLSLVKALTDSQYYSYENGHNIIAVTKQYHPDTR